MSCLENDMTPKIKGFSQSIDMNAVRMGRVIKTEKKTRIFLSE